MIKETVTLTGRVLRGSLKPSPESAVNSVVEAMLAVDKPGQRAHYHLYFPENVLPAIPSSGDFSDGTLTVIGFTVGDAFRYVTVTEYFVKDFNDDCSN